MKALLMLATFAGSVAFANPPAAPAETTETTTKVETMKKHKKVDCKKEENKDKEECKAH